MARTLVKSVDIVPRTDNQGLDGRYENGVPPVSVPVITVLTPIDLPYTAGQSVSQNLASYVTGADASGYVMTLEPVFGTLAGVGLSLSTTTISGTAVQAGFTYRLRVSKSGFNFDAPQTSQIVVSPASVTDTLPGTVPKFLTLVQDNATPKITLGGDFGMDLRSAGISPTDNVKVEIWKKIGSGTETLLATKTASAAQPSPLMSGSVIGSASLATFSQSGADITISNVTDGLVSNTVDNTNFYGGSVTLQTGDRIMITLPVFTSGYDYSEASLRICQSLTSLDRCIRVVRRPDAVNHASPMLSRTTLGAIQSYDGTDAIVTGEVDICVEKLASNQWKLTQYNPAGAVIDITIHTVVMSGPVFVGPELNRGAPGAAISAVFKNFTISRQPRWSLEDLAVPSGEEYQYRVRSKDGTAGGNPSAYGNTLSATITPTLGNAIKYHPGDYMWPIPGATPDNYPGDGSLGGISGRRFDLAIHRDKYLEFLDEIAAYPEIKGIQIVCDWKALEGDTPGDFSAGFAALDIILARCALRGKRLMLSWQTVVFGNFARLSDIFPTYLGDQSTPTDANNNYGLTTMTGNDGTEYHGVTARTWQRHTGDRVIAVQAAYAARYNSQSHFEMITMGETALDCQPGLNGFSIDNQETELLRQIPLMRASWLNTAIRIGANDFHPDARMTRLLDVCDANYCAVGGPDIWLGDVTQADRQFAGYDETYPTRLQIYTDRRDRIPWAIEVQFQSFSGYNGYIFTLAQLRDGTLNGYTPKYANGVPRTDQGPIVGMKTKYLVWWRNDYAGAQSTWWQTPGTGQRDFIRANPLYPLSTVVAAPSRYPAVNRN